ncbi:hypothetical protein [Vibrio cholerae]|uniref:hypothetical protein n=1 Tax=Vibrio cholerae TaxID=666 RepID=UPI0011DA104B|nr:hypothetical protein [Vibrio cholerae]TXY71601.1 hypothetical protein FXE85_10545 [Vibrio cholerae]GHW84028.1 hypothetical protein VCSRO199_2236 [Vibrio cholerae]GHX12108.1 hypothetical protein VCSRO106_2497 [Vibrio cholerae]
MRKQQGAAVLLVVCVLLVAALIMSLGSYKTLFYQIKRTNNQIESRQEYWRTEGGLECAYSKTKQNNTLPTNVNECITEMSLDALTFSSGIESIVTSTIGYRETKKTIKLPTVSAPGAIKSTSDLVINGSYTSSPDPGKNVGGNFWECTSVLYSQFFYATSVSTFHPWQLADKPYLSFPSSPAGQEQKCADTHYSWGKSIADSKSDYRKLPDMDPFNDVFDVPRDNWFDVMSNNSLFGYVPLSLNSITLNSASDLPSPVFNDTCADGIVSNINNGKDLIWVYGGCEIDTTGFTSIKNAIDNKLGGRGIILVVQDGIFSTIGTQNFKGMLYHFISPLYSSLSTGFTDWSTSANNADLDGVITALNTVVPMDKHKVGYYQHGSFNPLGGFVMDAPGTFAVFNSAISFTYNRDVIEEPLKKLKKVRWKKGSWNDF